MNIPHQDRAMFTKVNEAVRDYMYKPSFDPSHDYEHIQRVVANAYRIYTAELARSPQELWIAKVNPVTVYLAAMMHDVGEPKYLLPGESQDGHVRDLLAHCGVPSELAQYIGAIVPRVSFTRENKLIEQGNNDQMFRDCEEYPELRIVQDSDRLDAMGLVGQARCFVYGGKYVQRLEQTMHMGVILQRVRFEKTVELMKTETGRAEADVRWARMLEFRRVYSLETDVSGVCDFEMEELESA
ncbi:hypothetical protein P280DRAFT_400532 [Massarina eburnea CBS 473.64]|uniref:HD/PDEase domain-containing protein n=1 Tax=Massarina eburnea CBS 473.64 TaxID=1395130 RepID=A0A6A6RZH8_9PLEO|nr:hypothetical protein P280DRAFT_400532 [Massarina eburnea CBS 473.64]